jgi:hypothetical protein
VWQVVDGCHRVRPERLIQRTGKAGVNGFINNTALKVGRGRPCCVCPEKSLFPPGGHLAKSKKADAGRTATARNGGLMNTPVRDHMSVLCTACTSPPPPRITPM